MNERDARRRWILKCVRDQTFIVITQMIRFTSIPSAYLSLPANSHTIQQITNFSFLSRNLKENGNNLHRQLQQLRLRKSRMRWISFLCLSARQPSLLSEV